MVDTLDREKFDTDYEQYALDRKSRRAQMLPVRSTRRVALGDMLVAEFENATTLTFQVQEMLYTERIADEAEITHEIEAYSRMLPTSHELCATIFVELDDPTTIRAELARLQGLQHALRIEVGDHAVPGTELVGLDEEAGDTETVSVHVVRFTFSQPARDAFRDPSVPARLVVDHPAYSDDTPLTGETRTSLLADLSLETV